MCHVTDLAANCANVGRAQDRDFSARRLGQAGKRAQQCGLSRSVIAQNYIEAPRSELRAYAAQGGEPAKLLDQAID